MPAKSKDEKILQYKYNNVYLMNLQLFMIFQFNMRPDIKLLKKYLKFRS